MSHHCPQGSLACMLHLFPCSNTTDSVIASPLSFKSGVQRSRETYKMQGSGPSTIGYPWCSSFIWAGSEWENSVFFYLYFILVLMQFKKNPQDTKAFDVLVFTFWQKLWPEYLNWDRLGYLSSLSKISINTTQNIILLK